MFQTDFTTVLGGLYRLKRHLQKRSIPAIDTSRSRECQF